jgi:hypothetical protein
VCRLLDEDIPMWSAARVLEDFLSPFDAAGPSFLPQQQALPLAHKPPHQAADLSRAAQASFSCAALQVAQWLIPIALSTKSPIENSEEGADRIIRLYIGFL